MKKENKIISFQDYKNNKLKTKRIKYILKYIIQIDITKFLEHYTIHVSYPDKLTKEQFYYVANNMYDKAISRVNTQKYDGLASLQKHYIIMYFENRINPADFVFISQPKINMLELSALLSLVISKGM